jgi:hypothetical protein
VKWPINIDVAAKRDLRDGKDEFNNMIDSGLFEMHKFSKEEA